MSEKQVAEQATDSLSMEEFLEGVPPGQARVVDKATESVHPINGAWYYKLLLPELNLHCSTEVKCKGVRAFRPISEVAVSPGMTEETFINYVCRNCVGTRKTFAVQIIAPKENRTAVMYKLGEIPNFGPPTSPRLTRLLGGDAALFLKGRIAENQGMGIAAFAYYRRVIESQKDALFDEIIRVSKAIGADESIITGLEQAKSKIQFSNAMEDVKVAVPATLMINGYNPLTLLHSALSHRLHAGTEAQCLEDATDARVVLAELIRRMAEAMKDEAELKSAVSRLANVRQKQEKTQG